MALTLLMFSSICFSQQPADRHAVEAKYNQIYDAIQKISKPEDFDPARKEVADFRQAFPSSPYPLIALGQLNYTESRFYYRQALMDEALALGQEAVRMDKAVAEGYMLMSTVFSYKRNGAEASTLADQALALAPNKSAAFSTKGRSEQASGRFESAAAWFQKAANAQ